MEKNAFVSKSGSPNLGLGLGLQDLVQFFLFVCYHSKGKEQDEFRIYTEVR